MQIRDVFAACVGFTVACALQIIPCYLARPSLLLASLQVVCGMAFLASIAGYVTAATRSDARVGSRDDRPSPDAEFQLVVTGKAATVAHTVTNGARAHAPMMHGASLGAANSARPVKHTRPSQAPSTSRSTPVQ